MTPSCWHCHDTARCDCMFCGKTAKGGAWLAGDCQSCNGRQRMDAFWSQPDMQDVDPRESRHWRYAKDITGGGHRVLAPQQDHMDRSDNSRQRYFRLKRRECEPMSKPSPFTIDDAFLQSFCLFDDSGKYALSRPYLYTSKDGRAYTFATDGHRMLIVPGHREGLKPGGPSIESFLVEPQGVAVSAKALMDFLGEAKREPCGVEDCEDGIVTCVCPTCNNEHTYECGCKGRPILPERKGWLGHVPFNTSLLAEMMKGVTDETVQVYLKSNTAVIHVFASDRHLAVMPMHADGSFKDAPRFEMPTQANVEERT
jgi:hypothetical protein